MNVIVSNLNRDVFSKLDVDVLKAINGEFSADEIVKSFSNFFFNRMFLDITAIQNYTDIENIRKISMGLDVSKVILLLNDNEIVNSGMYISRLINMGIYNFAKNIEEVEYLYAHPNQYKDVAHLQQIDENLLQVQENMIKNDVRVIGFKNFTSHAGASSLIYMLKKQLSSDYYVICLEVNKKDFIFFREKDMYSVTEKELVKSLDDFKEANIILIDLNDVDDVMASSICSDVVYLVEPSILGINKVFMLDQDSFDKLKDFKVVLNDCLLNERDVSRFSREAGIKVFYTLPPLNDRIDNSKILLPFLEKLELYKKIDGN